MTLIEWSRKEIESFKDLTKADMAAIIFALTIRCTIYGFEIAVIYAVASCCIQK
jgi:hypothetical protein